MREALITILHPVHAAITEREAKSALTDDDCRRFTRAITLDSLSCSRDDTASLNWASAQRSLAREFREKVAPHVREARFAYFGLAPIPLAMQLGYLLEEMAQLDVYQRRHDGTDSWSWAATGATQEVHVARSHDIFEIDAPGDVIVRVSTWHPIDAAATRAALAHGALLEVDLTLGAPGPDALAAPADLRAVVARFRDELDAISDRMKGATIHVFAAVPVGLALELGRAVSPSKHRPVQTYQFLARETPSHKPAFVLQQIAPPPSRALSTRDLEQAEAERGVWNQELHELGTRAAALSSEGDAWADAVELAENDSWRALPSLATLLPVLTTVASEAPVPEFEFDPERGGRWLLSPGLLLGVASTVPDEQSRRLAARLFFLHEGLHHQWHALTAATSRGIGRLPRVLEELDYQADAWAILQELASHVRAGRPQPVQFVQTCVATALATFWAFNEGSAPLDEIPVRRLNRYLIWYWQALRLEKATSLTAATTVLAHKPTLEIAGLEPFTVGDRVMCRLDRHREQLELAVFENDMVARRPQGEPYRIGDLLGSFRDRDSQGVKSALRGVFESVVARHTPSSTTSERTRK